MQVRQSSISVGKKEVFVTRIWIAHTCLTHGHLLHGSCLYRLVCPLLFPTSWWNAYVMQNSHTFHLHFMLCDIHGENFCNVSDMLAFLNGVGPSKSV